ncbi:unnamed protein product [Urochloa humidicola]
MASPSRRFQNLITHDRFTGAKSLRCVDLTRQLFGISGSGSALHGVKDSTSQASSLAADSFNHKMERIRLPCPIFTLQAAAPNDPRSKIDCFPLADRKMLWADHLGRPFVFDAETRQMDILPCLHRPKSTPFSLFVPNADADADDLHHRHGSGSSLFVMERIPSWSAEGDGQFEAFVFYKPTVSSYTKSRQWILLPPPPPYVRQLKHHCNSHRQPEISSYAVVSGVAGGASQVWISVDGVGTYCLDTESHTWNQVGEWTLPFRGKAEYVPELDLWFGLSADAGDLAAADLSAVDSSRPRLVGAWKELCVTEGWKECKDSQLVNLGSGKFCIARFFRATTTTDGSSREGSSGENFAVMTGLEVVPPLRGADSNGGNGRVEFRMIRHKSKRVNDTTFEVF